MVLPEYLSDVARDMRGKSAAIRRDFTSHRLSAGENREGQPNSQHRAQVQAQHGAKVEALVPEPAEVGELNEKALLAWYVWFDSWLRQAGNRLTDPVAYLPPDQVFGRTV